MQVVVIKDFKLLGKKGEVKNIKEGYFRNFLFPRKIAVAANKGNLKMAEEIQKKMVFEKERLVSEAKEVVKKLEALNIEIKSKVTAEDKLYGAVKAKDILEKIEDSSKIRLERKNLEDYQPIKKLGKYKLKIRINEEVTTSVNLSVVKE